MRRCHAIVLSALAAAGPAVAAPAARAAAQVRALHASPIFMHLGRHGFTPTSLARASDGATWGAGQPGLLVRWDAAGVEKLVQQVPAQTAVAAVTAGDVWVASPTTDSGAITLRRLHANGTVAATATATVPAPARPVRRVALAAALDGRLGLVVSGGADGAIASYVMMRSATGASTWAQQVGCSDGPCVGDGIAMDGDGGPIVIADRQIQTGILNGFEITQLIRYGPGGLIRGRNDSYLAFLGAGIFEGCRAVGACGMPDDVARSTAGIATLDGGYSVRYASVEGNPLGTLAFPSAPQRLAGIVPTAIAVPSCVASVIVGVPSLPVRTFAATPLGACKADGPTPPPVSLGVPAISGATLQVELACTARCGGTLIVVDRRGRTVARGPVPAGSGYRVLGLDLSPGQLAALAGGVGARFRTARVRPAVPFRTASLSLAAAPTTIGVGQGVALRVALAGAPKRARVTVRIVLVGPAVRARTVVLRTNASGAAKGVAHAVLDRSGTWRATASIVGPALLFGASDPALVRVRGPQERRTLLRPVRATNATCAATDVGSPLVAGDSVTVQAAVLPVQRDVPVTFSASTTSVRVAHEAATAQDGTASTTFVVSRAGTWTFRAIGGGVPSTPCVLVVG